MLAVAHRHGNDLAALRAALDAGVDLVEADVHLFRGALEVRHAAAVGRHLFWEEEGYRLGWRRDVVLPELADVLKTADGDPRLMLDLKGPLLAVAPQVAKLLRELAPDSAVAVCTKQWRMLDAFRADPHVRLVHSAANRFQLARLLRQPRLDYGVSIRLALLTPDVVAQLRDRDQTVLAWPVDTPEDLSRARRLGVSGVISKNLPMLRELLEAR